MLKKFYFVRKFITKLRSKSEQTNIYVPRTKYFEPIGINSSKNILSRGFLQWNYVSKSIYNKQCVHKFNRQFTPHSTDPKKCLETPYSVLKRYQHVQRCNSIDLKLRRPYKHSIAQRLMDQISYKVDHHVDC